MDASLNELSLTNFKINNETDTRKMFSGCLDELKLRIKNKYKNSDEMAFENFDDD